ncbi:hypothetical protein HK101_007036, partial [Irineochytrium annulatum]
MLQHRLRTTLADNRTFRCRRVAADFDELWRCVAACAGEIGVGYAGLAGAHDEGLGRSLAGAVGCPPAYEGLENAVQDARVAAVPVGREVEAELSIAISEKMANANFGPRASASAPEIGETSRAMGTHRSSFSMRRSRASLEVREAFKVELHQARQGVVGVWGQSRDATLVELPGVAEQESLPNTVAEAGGSTVPRRSKRRGSVASG